MLRSAAACLFSAMSTAARRRVMRDVKRMKSEPPEGTMLDDEPLNNNIMTWHAALFGPEDTLWDGLVAKLHFEFSEEMPCTVIPTGVAQAAYGKCAGIRALGHRPPSWAGRHSQQI